MIELNFTKEKKIENYVKCFISKPISALDLAVIPVLSRFLWGNDHLKSSKES